MRMGCSHLEKASTTRCELWDRMEQFGGLTLLLLSLTAVVLLMFTYVGAFHGTVPTTGQTPFRFMTIWYKFHMGQYVGNVASQTLGLVEAFKLGTPPRNEVRIVFVYYDNPYALQRSYGTDALCRWVVAVAMAEHERQALTPEEFSGLETELQEQGYQPFVIKGGEVARSTFYITLSPLLHSLNRTIRVQKVYPALMRYLKQSCGKSHTLHPILEVCHRGKAETMIAVDPNLGYQWYVPEAPFVEASRIVALLQDYHGA